MALEDRIFAYMNGLRGLVSMDRFREALYLLKKTKEVYSESKENETEENVYNTMLSLAAEAKILSPFNNSKTFYASYITIDKDVPWEAFLGVKGSKMEMRLPKILIYKMEERFEPETSTVLIPEAEKFTICLSELIDAHKSCKFTLATRNMFYYSILQEIYSDNESVEVIHANVYSYEFVSKKFDLILAAPEFGGRDLGENRQFMCRECDLIALENLLLHLNSNGRLAIVLAARVTFAEGKIGDLRDFVQSMYKLEEIDELPNGTFAPYTAIKAYLITISTGKTEDVIIKRYSSGAEKPSRLNPINELIEEDDTFVMEEELREIGNWNLDMIFAMQSDAWMQYQNSNTPKNQLGDVAEIFRGKTVNQKDDNGRIGVINITNVGNYDIVYDNLDHLELEDRKISNYVLKEGDVIIPARGTALRIGIFEEQVYPCIPSSNLIVIRPNPKLLKSVCLKIFLDSEMGRKLLMGMQQGSAVVNISYKDLSSLEVPTPPIEEQEIMVERYITERSKYKETIQKAEERWQGVLAELQKNL